MTRRTRFEIMRCNQRWRHQKVEAVIDGIETQVDREWADQWARLQAERRAQYPDTVDWLRDTRRETRMYPKAQMRRRRRWWLLWIR